MPREKSSKTPRFTTTGGLHKHKYAYLVTTKTTRLTPGSWVLLCTGAPCPHTHSPLKAKQPQNQIFSFPSYSTSSPNQEEPPLMLHRFHFAPCRVSAHPPNTCIRHTPQFNKHMNVCFTLNTEVQSALHRLKYFAGSKHECSADRSFCKAPQELRGRSLLARSSIWGFSTPLPSL